MKKLSGVITLVLAGVLMIAVTAITAYHCYQGERVVVEETIVYGDKALVEDIAITQQDTMDSRLIWTVTTPLWDVTQGETELEQSRSALYYTTSHEGWLDISYSLNISGSTSSTFDFIEWERSSFGGGYPIAMFQDVMSRVPSGEEYTETVCVSDYGDYYTPEVYMTLPSATGGYRWMDDESEEKIAQYFRIPVGEEDMATITMTHNGFDGINEITVDLEGESSWKYDYPVSLFVGNDIYVATSYEKGITLHRIHWRENDESGYMEVESIQQVAQLPGETILSWPGMALREENNHLFVLCGQSRLSKMIVLSLATMEVEQVIAVDEFDLNRIYQGEDFIALLDYSGGFILYEDNDGQYTQVLEGSYAAHLEEGVRYDYNVTAMDYRDGELITAFRSYRDYGSAESHVYVSVNTDQGCIFTGEYTTSLQRDVPLDGYYSFWVEQWGSPLEIVRLVG